jgi:short-subunit dehydrogenase
MRNGNSRRAVITGASSGIGEDMARCLASWGWDLLIAARRLDRLESLAADLRDRHGVQVDCLSVDLAEPAGAGALFEAAYADGRDVDMLVNNAGFGDFQGYVDTPWERQAQMLQLNVVSLAELTHRFAERMLARDERGYILNVSSIVAYLPIPNFANYTGTKAYIRFFSESLASELDGTNVSVTCLVPGPTDTEFSNIARNRVSATHEKFFTQSRKVAVEGLEGALAGRRTVVVGGTIKAFALLTRLTPGRTLSWGSKQIMGKPDSR